MIEFYKGITDALGSLGGAPGYVITLLLCVACAYVSKRVHRIPDESIPVLVVAWGMAWNIFLADPYASPASLRLWVAKNLGIGFIIGFVALLTRRQVEKRLAWLTNGNGNGNGNSDPRAFVNPNPPKREPPPTPPEVPKPPDK